MQAVNENEEYDQPYASGSSFRDITGNYPFKKSTIPLKRIHSNVFENTPIIIQQTNTIKKLEIRNTVSLSSTENEVFYEASPELIDNPIEPEVRFYPTLLQETNYPTVNVTIQPHMTKPLTENVELNLQDLINPIDLPYNMFLNSHTNQDKDSLTLLNIFKYELKSEAEIKPNIGWFKKWFKFEGRVWSEFITSEIVTEVEENEDMYLDKVFEYIYDIY